MHVKRMFECMKRKGMKKIAANKAKIWWNQESVIMSRYDIFFFVTMSEFVKVFLKEGGGWRESVNKYKCSLSLWVLCIPVFCILLCIVVWLILFFPTFQVHKRIISCMQCETLQPDILFIMLYYRLDKMISLK